MASTATKVKALRKALSARDPFDNGDVLMFERELGRRSYSYAALKAGGRWYVTGSYAGSLTFQELIEEHLEDAEAIRVVTATEEVLNG